MQVRVRVRAHGTGQGRTQQCKAIRDPSLKSVFYPMTEKLSLTSSEMFNMNPRNTILKIKGVNSVAQPIEQGTGVWGCSLSEMAA